MCSASHCGSPSGNRQNSANNPLPARAIRAWRRSLWSEDRRALRRAGVLPARAEVVAFSEPEAPDQERFLRLSGLARRLALRVALGGGRVDVDPGEAVGLRLC